MVGYDMDGVICSPKPKWGKRWSRMDGAERQAYQAAMTAHMMTADPLLAPEGEYVIITGRREKDASVTREWLRQHGLAPVEVCFLKEAKTRANMIEHKRAHCLKHRVTAFYEDDEKIARMLRKAGINVVVVKNGQAAT